MKRDLMRRLIALYICLLIAGSLMRGSAKPSLGSDAPTLVPESNSGPVAQTLTPVPPPSSDAETSVGVPHAPQSSGAIEYEKLCKEVLSRV